MVEEIKETEEVIAKVEKNENISTECDVLTMNCHEMPKMMETLMRKENILTEGIGRIDELKKMFPSRKELDNLHEDAIRAKEKIHGTISDITTRFSMCTLKEEKPEETVEEEPISEESSEETTTV